jgi:uncharacterized protein (DUF1330 family)
MTNPIIEPGRRRKRMKKGYWVASYRSITDPQALRDYSAQAGPAIEAAGGKFLSRGIAIAAHEAGWVERTVIVEFESVERAKAAYETYAYREALAAMMDGVERDFRILEGA